MRFSALPRSTRARHAFALAAAWLGGAAFVASLLYFGYFYAVRLGRAPGGVGSWAAPLAPGAGAPTGRGLTDPALLRAVFLDLLLVAAFAGHHSVMARDRAKRWLSRHLAPAFERTLYVWVASLLFVLVCWAWEDVPGELYRIEGWMRWLFHAAQVGGALLAVVSARSIDVFELAGIRQVQRVVAGSPDASPVGLPRATASLTTSGPYRLVRHPIYLGWLLFVFGTPVMTLNRLTFAVLSTAYLLAAVPLEERALRREFGAAYDAYARRVRWRAVPGLW